MTREEEKREILAFTYGERLKAELLAVGQVLDTLASLQGPERQGALALFRTVIAAVAGDLRLAARVLGGEDLRGLDARIELVEGFVRLVQLPAAREELSVLLSRVTTVSGRAMAALRGKGLL
ncbi:MAG: hypothetical protein H6Q51_1875 [Deltaproteobacteria bacterium]|jgi:hypothetical protein|nr:hypothetical protein [Deltaproteobacteria bacterium]